MYESGYYPAGAEHDPNAPWNRSDPEPVSRDIEYSCTMRRTADVETANYVPGTWEKDEDGNGYRDGDDCSDTDWLGEFKQQYRTPSGLIGLLKATAVELAQGVMPAKTMKFWQDVVADCEKWSIEDEYAEEV